MEQPQLPLERTTKRPTYRRTYEPHHAHCLESAHFCLRPVGFVTLLGAAYNAYSCTDVRRSAFGPERTDRPDVHERLREHLRFASEARCEHDPTAPSRHECRGNR